MPEMLIGITIFLDQSHTCRVRNRAFSIPDAGYRTNLLTESVKELFASGRNWV
jgi:hypothetical protein